MPDRNWPPGILAGAKLTGALGLVEPAMNASSLGRGADRIASGFARRLQPIRGAPSGCAEKPFAANGTPVRRIRSADTISGEVRGVCQMERRDRDFYEHLLTESSGSAWARQPAPTPRAPLNSFRSPEISGGFTKGLRLTLLAYPSMVRERGTSSGQKRL
jgi:hypothetical protein